MQQSSCSSKVRSYLSRIAAISLPSVHLDISCTHWNKVFLFIMDISYLVYKFNHCSERNFLSKNLNLKKDSQKSDSSKILMVRAVLRPGFLPVFGTPFLIFGEKFSLLVKRIVKPQRNDRNFGSVTVTELLITLGFVSVKKRASETS